MLDHGVTPNNIHFAIFERQFTIESNGRVATVEAIKSAPLVEFLLQPNSYPESPSRVEMMGQLHWDLLMDWLETPTNRQEL